MSSSLYWKPVQELTEDRYIGKQAKYLLGLKYFGHDGSLGGEATLDKLDILWLDGARAATPHTKVREELTKIIELLEEHGSIILELRF